MRLPTSSIILGTLILATIVIAYVGDTLGKHIGKRRVSVLGLRPRHTGILISVLTGVLILAMAVTAMTLASRHVRDALFRMDSLRQDNQRLERERKALEKQRTELDKKVKSASAEVRELTGRVSDLTKQVAQSNANLAATRSALLSAKTDLVKQRKALTVTEDDLKLTKQMLESRRTDLEAKRAELTKVQTSLVEVQEEFRNAEHQLNTGEKLVVEQGRKILALEQQETTLRGQVNDLEDEIGKLEKYRRELAAIARRAWEGDIIYEANQVLGRATLPAGVSAAETRRQLVALLEAASQEAARRGAVPGTEGQRTVRLATRRVDTVTGPVYYWEGQLLDSLAEDIAKTPGGVVAELRALRNYVSGEQVLGDFLLFPNRLVFRAGEVLVTRQLRHATSKADLFQAILTMLQELRQHAQKRGMRPNLTGGFGEVSYAQIFETLEQIEKLNRDVTFSILTAEEAWTAGPLKIKFSVK